MGLRIFKIWINLVPALRGSLKSFLIGIFHADVHFGKRTRMKKNSELKLFPRCNYTSGDNLIIGKDVTINVAADASLSLGDNVGIGNRCQIVCHRYIKVGEGTILAPNVMLFDHNHVFDAFQGVHQRAFSNGEIVIGNHCWLGAGVIVLKDVHIGDNCVIGAGSVVTKDIPSGCVAVGSPAKVIKQLD